MSSTIRQSFRLEGAELPCLRYGRAWAWAPMVIRHRCFPHTEGLQEVMRIAIANHVAQQKESWRVTLTWPVIDRARDVFFLIEGADKVEALKHGISLGPYHPETLSIAVDPARQPPHYTVAGFRRCRRIASPRKRMAKADWRSHDDPGGRCGRHQGRTWLCASSKMRTTADRARSSSFHARDFSGLVQVVDAFLDQCKQAHREALPRCCAACFGVPGPVRQWPPEVDQSSLGTGFAVELAVDLNIEARLSDQ
jgi:hypothetical protein